MTAYTYSIQADFSAFSQRCLHVAIKASDLSDVFEYIQVESDICSIIFSRELTAEEVARLQIIVDAHDPPVFPELHHIVATMAHFHPAQAALPEVGGAVLGARNGHAVLEFAADVRESAIFSGYMPLEYDCDPLIVDIYWVAETATEGAVRWDVEFECVAFRAQDIDEDGFESPQSVTTNAPVTCGVVTRSEIALTQAQADVVLKIDLFRLRVSRDIEHENDTMEGNAQVMRVVVRR